MSPDGAIAAHGIWKRFRSDRSPRSILQQGARALAPRRRGWTWALQDIDLDVGPGEAVGLVGVNGSGKSTLLKILTQVMYPYAGAVEVGGQVGALIEVQAGLHPQLSGRENVFLYGAFVGMTRRDVQRHFDHIVDFAEIESAVDRQVKFYSSGMKMRLGFAVAAFLDPAVLLVDEVLAVGDASFQQRCLQQLRDSIGLGTTLVFVSHDLPAVASVCQRAVWLEGGRVVADAGVDEVLGGFRDAMFSVPVGGEVSSAGLQLRARDPGAAGGRMGATGEPLEVEFELQSDGRRLITAYAGVGEPEHPPVFVVRREVEIPEGPSRVRVRFDAVPLGRGRYAVWFGADDRHGHHLIPWQRADSVDVAGPDAEQGPAGVSAQAPIQVAATWLVDGE